MDIEAVMQSLYAAQISLTKARGRDPKLQQSFEHRRQSLQACWRLILSFLKDSHAFGSDVITLNDLIRTEPAESGREFLKTLSVSSTELRGGAMTLIGTNEKYFDDLENPRPQWSEASGQSSSGVQVRSTKWITDALGIRQSQGRLLRASTSHKAFH
jgi:hypothetical protein